MSIFHHSKQNTHQNSNVTYVKHRNHDDDIVLSEQLDEGSLERFWDKVVQDIHHDPEWFTFADE
jgi:hypothetical protein